MIWAIESYDGQKSWVWTLPFTVIGAIYFDVTVFSPICSPRVFDDPPNTIDSNQKNSVIGSVTTSTYPDE